MNETRGREVERRVFLLSSFVGVLVGLMVVVVMESCVVLRR